MNVAEIEICDTRMFVCDSSSERTRAKISNDAPHAHYAIRRHEIHAELAAFQRVVKRVGKVGRVIEMFGGSGWHSMLIQKHCQPNIHLAFDINKDCVESIRMSLPLVEARVGDSYAAISSQRNRGWEWVHADFNQLTFNRYLTNHRYKDAVDSIFRVAGRWATITDSAVFGVSRFPKNRASYVTSIGMDPDDWQDYFRAVADQYKERFGFGTVAVVVWHRMSAMFVLKRGAAVDFQIEEVKDKVPVRVIGTRRAGKDEL